MRILLTLGTAIALTMSATQGLAAKIESDAFVFRIPSEPPNIDPAKGVDNVSIDLMLNLNEGLMEFDKNMKPIPNIAESYQISKDGKTYTFKMRKNVKWSDGAPLTAKQFVETWERMLNPKTAAEYAYFLYDIKNAEDYNAGKIKDFSEVGVKAPDDHTIVVTLRAAASYWLNMPAYSVLHPIRIDLIAKYGDKYQEAGNYQGVGAYKLVKWEHDKRLVLEANEHYFGKAPAIKKAVALVVEDASTGLSLFNKGTLDLMRRLPPLEIERYKQTAQFHFGSYLRGYYYGFNIKKKPFDDVRVRKAFAHAIDRSVLPTVLKGGQNPVSSWIPKGMLAYNPEIGLKFDPEKARKLLAEAGYPEGKGFPRTAMTFDTREDNKVVAEAIQNMWKKVLNVNMEVNQMEWKVYLDAMKADAAPVFRLGWGADFPDPHNFMDLFLTKSGNNHTRWGNEKYDNLVRQASAELNPKKRVSIYNQAQKIMLEQDAAIVPLFNESLNWLVSERVKDFQLDSMGRLYLKRYSMNQMNLLN